MCAQKCCVFDFYLLSLIVASNVLFIQFLRLFHFDTLSSAVVSSARSRCAPLLFARSAVVASHCIHSFFPPLFLFSHNAILHRIASSFNHYFLPPCIRRSVHTTHIISRSNISHRDASSPPGVLLILPFHFTLLSGYPVFFFSLTTTFILDIQLLGFLHISSFPLACVCNHSTVSTLAWFPTEKKLVFFLCNSFVYHHHHRYRLSSVPLSSLCVLASFIIVHTYIHREGLRVFRPKNSFFFSFSFIL